MAVSEFFFCWENGILRLRPAIKGWVTWRCLCSFLRSASTACWWCLCSRKPFEFNCILVFVLLWLFSLHFFSEWLVDMSAWRYDFLTEISLFLSPVSCGFVRACGIQAVVFMAHERPWKRHSKYWSIETGYSYHNSVFIMSSCGQSSFVPDAASSENTVVLSKQTLETFRSFIVN
jgi:hypothetical protein